MSSKYGKTLLAGEHQNMSETQDNIKKIKVINLYLGIHVINM